MFISPLVIFLIVLFVVVVWLLAATVRKGRASGPPGNPRTCAECGTVHPGHAAFCRRCGARLA